MTLKLYFMKYLERKISQCILPLRSCFIAQIVLIKPFTMEIYFLISFIQISTNRFTQKCGCFKNHGDIFLFLKHILKYVKTSGKILIIDRIMSIFLWSKIFQTVFALSPFHPPPLKIIFQCVYAPLYTSASSPLWYTAPPKSHIQEWIILGCIGIEMLFSLQIFTRNIKE